MNLSKLHDLVPLPQPPTCKHVRFGYDRDRNLFVVSVSKDGIPKAVVPAGEWEPRPGRDDGAVSLMKCHQDYLDRLAKDAEKFS